MAITAAGQRVRVKLTSAAFTGVYGLLQPQPPLVGVVTDVTTGTATVDMGNGTTLAVATTVLDEVSAPSTTTVRDTYLDKIVNGVGYTSSYTGRVVDVYGVNGADSVLVQALANGMFYELLVAEVAVLANR
jgi:hypothetical protein